MASFYKFNAQRKGLGWNIPLAAVVELIFRDCLYCGAKPSNRFTVQRPAVGQRAKSLLYTGLDRLDSSQGYTVGNVIPCCFECNSIKSNILSPAEMLEVAKALNNFRKKPLRFRRR